MKIWKKRTHLTITHTASPHHHENATQTGNLIILLNSVNANTPSNGIHKALFFRTYDNNKNPEISNVMEIEGAFPKCYPLIFAY